MKRNRSRRIEGYVNHKYRRETYRFETNHLLALCQRQREKHLPLGRELYPG